MPYLNIDDFFTEIAWPTICILTIITRFRNWSDFRLEKGELMRDVQFHPSWWKIANNFPSETTYLPLLNSIFVPDFVFKLGTCHTSIYSDSDHKYMYTGSCRFLRPKWSLVANSAIRTGLLISFPPELNSVFYSPSPQTRTMLRLSLTEKIKLTRFKNTRNLTFMKNHSPQIGSKFIKSSICKTDFTQFHISFKN